MFHYTEIMKYHGKDSSDVIKALGDIDTSVQASFLVTDHDRGSKMMDIIANMRRDRDNGVTEDEENYTKLTDTDEELLAFADSLPKEIDISDNLKHTGRFILPTKKLSDIIGKDNVYEEVDSINDLSSSFGEDLVNSINIEEVDSFDDFEPGLG